MDIIRFSIRNPVKVVVAVVFILLGGWAAVTSIPVQLMPNVDRPVVSIWTRWDGAAPREVEREIIEPQEEQLKALADLYKMTSASNDSFAMIRLEFNVGVEKEAALREVSERLDLVRRYPDGADERVIQAADSSSSTHVAWLRLHADDGRDIADLQHWVYENVRPLIKRVKGVATVDVWGGREREVQVVIDPGELAARGLTFRDVEHALRGHNTNVSAGTVPSGKRDFTVRTIGQYESLDVLANTIIAYRAGGPVYVRDVAEVRDDFKKRFSFVRSRRPGKPVGFGLSMPIRRETGGNVLEIIEGRGPRKVTRTGTGQVSIERPRKGLKDVLEEINANLLAPRGLHASISYDESEYIGAAIDQVRTNILVGAMLATVVLLLFLRSVRGTAVVAAAIPISAVGTFWGVFALGRSLNVIMLAGMTFAIGMVVDNAIVVLENIHRHREMGKDRFAAAYDGAHEVWGAVLASTLTTMAVFIPVIFIEDEAGQLFRDIAIAVSVGVGLSLIVAITVIPTLSAKLLSSSAPRSGRGRLARVVADGVHRINRTVLARVAVVVMLTGLSVVGMVMLKPPATYMPSGNRNWVSGHLQAPPGRTVDEFRDYAAIIERELTPYWNAELGSPEEQALRTQWIETVRKTTLPEIENNPDLSKEQKEQQIREWLAPPPPIDSFFFGTWRNWVMMGCSSKNPDVARPLEKLISSIAPKLPGVVLTASQNSLLGGGSGNSIAVELSADDLDDVVGAAKAVSEACERKFGAPPSPEPPNFDTGSPELRIVPHHEQAAGLGLSVRDVGFIIEVCVDGALVGEFRDRGESIDLVMKLRETEADGMERIANVPIIAPSGQTIPLSSAVSVSHTTSPTAIHHVEERPAVVLHVAPPEGAALEDAMMAVEEEIIAPLRGEGKINSRVRHKLAGNADKLTRTFDAVKWNLLWALVITYFLIAALFESFTYPFVILFSVPLAAAGGFAGLAVAHHRSVLNPVEPVQQMDILTMLGFVLLIGVVVNNAILLIHQARNNMIHGGLAPDEAIRESVRTRIRPIFMSALTTVCGMLPLVLRFGAGSELYRGMGSVMVGGLIVSTVFTLLLVPTLFSLVLDARAAILRTVGLPALHRIASPARGVVATGRQEER